MIIKETKRNLNEKLIRVYLPPGFGEFFQIMESMDYYDRPDYEKLTRILEKAKEIIPYYSKTKTMNTLVDQELFEMDPLFLNYNELLLKYKQSKFKKVSNSLVLESSPSTNTASNHQIKQSPEKDQLHLPQIAPPQKVQSKLSEDDLANFMKAKHAQKFAADQAQGQIAEVSIAQENEEFDQEARGDNMTDHEEYSDEEASPHAQKQQDSAMFIPRQMMAGSYKKTPPAEKAA